MCNMKGLQVKFVGNDDDGPPETQGLAEYEGKRLGTPRERELFVNCYPFCRVVHPAGKVYDVRSSTHK